MPEAQVNGVKLHYRVDGTEGPALVMVHGSWGDHHNWDLVAPGLARQFRVLRYDRRGHSESDAPPGPGRSQEDVDDLLALAGSLGMTPALVVGNSFGAALTLKAAASRPAAFRAMVVHEPPLIGMLDGDPAYAPLLKGVQSRISAVVELLEQGRMEAGAMQFVETVGLGPGMWAKLPPELKRTFVRNAATWLDEVKDPTAFRFDPAPLSLFGRPALLTQGTESPPFFGKVLDLVHAALPGAERATFKGAGHVPHVTHPDAYVASVTGFARAHGLITPERQGGP